MGGEVFLFLVGKREDGVEEIVKKKAYQAKKDNLQADKL